MFIYMRSIQDYDVEMKNDVDKIKLKYEEKRE